jgi:hypothetical protein
MAESMGPMKHGKYINELVTVKSKHPQVEYPLPIVQGGPDLNGAHFSMGIAYITKPVVMGGDPHSHTFDQILFFIGADLRNTKDFDAELEMFLEDKFEPFNYASFIHVPAGTMHGTVNVKKVNKPFIFIDVTLAPSGSSRPYATLVKKVEYNEPH